jgi:glutamine synthetase
MAAAAPVADSPVTPGVRFADFFFSDFKGGMHVMEESADNVAGILAGGVGVDGSSVGFATVDKSDILLRPDHDSKRTFAVEGEEVDAYFCRVFSLKGDLHPACPRQVLKRVIDKAATMGLECDMFSELEFYLLDEKTGEPIDHGKYLSLPPEDGALPFRRELCHMFEAAGIEVKRLHHEVGPAQQEVEYKLQPVLKNCDDTILGMWLTKMLARKYGWRATFEPKPLGEDIAGNGMHEHILLRETATGKNAMLGEDGGLNERAMQFIAGLLKYAPDICAVFGRDPSTFVRLRPGHEAPVCAIWGHAARNALVRIPTISKENLAGMRCEFRAGDASGSPHLMCAMILAAGLRGIEEELVAPPPPTKDYCSMPKEECEADGVTVLPTSMEECKPILEKSELIKETLGEHLTEKLIKTIV